MRGTERPTCPPDDHPLWVALSLYSIGAENAEPPFVTRLARENGWSAAQAERVIEEYKRFCFLAATAGHAVTPSEAVDQAWHLHLTYSRDYWERFCPLVMGYSLHHEPSPGGLDEWHRHVRQYAATLKSYERTFGQHAPEDLWPRADTPADHNLQVRRARLRNRRRNWLVRTITDSLEGFSDWVSSFSDGIGDAGGGAGCGSGGCGGCGG
jgi:hypothetical protein